MAPTDPWLDAIVRLSVACRLALEALPNLDDDAQQALREPIERVCQIADSQIERSRAASPRSRRAWRKKVCAARFRAKPS
jgi:hypothetical protein